MQITIERSAGDCEDLRSGKLEEKANRPNGRRWHRAADCWPVLLLRFDRHRIGALHAVITDQP